MWPKLKKQVQVEREMLERLLTDHETLMEKCAHSSPERIEISALAAMLHGFYSGIENIFKRIAIELDEEMPEGPAWQYNYDFYDGGDFIAKHGIETFNAIRSFIKSPGFSPGAIYKGIKLTPAVIESIKIMGATRDFMSANGIDSSDYQGYFFWENDSERMCLHNTFDQLGLRGALRTAEMEAVGHFRYIQSEQEWTSYDGFLHNIRAIREDPIGYYTVHWYGWPENNPY